VSLDVSLDTSCDTFRAIPDSSMCKVLIHMYGYGVSNITHCIFSTKMSGGIKGNIVLNAVA